MNILDKKGFTLIELLVVIAIIGVLSTLAIVALGSARTKARDSKRLNDLKQIATALELYYQDHSNYPIIITPGQSIKSLDGNTTYMAKIPSNPTPRNDNNCADADYVYTVNNQTNPTSYNISTCIGSTIGSNNAGAIAYSPTGLFNCGQKISDVDGNQYDTVQIGTQCWMKQNLNVGTAICTVGTTCATEPDNTFNYSAIEKYCYQNNSAYCTEYGALYTWPEALGLPNDCKNAAATDTGNETYSLACPTSGSQTIQAKQQGICPAGWHIPTDTEFNILEKYTVQIAASSENQYACDIDISSTGWRRCADNANGDQGGAKGAGKSLKKVGQGSGIGAGDDLVGFSALFTGYRDPAGSFDNLTSDSRFWLATQYDASSGWGRGFGVSSLTYSTSFRWADNKVFGFSVRCLKD